MITIRTPDFYLSEPGALKKLGKVTRRVLGGAAPKALILWSKTAREKVLALVTEELKAAGIAYREETFADYPTLVKAEAYARLVHEQKISVILAAGGGRTLDQGKAAATLAGVPVITIPTIAATCAAWAAVSILYREDGDYDQSYQNPRSAAAVVADTDIIAAAPAKYLRAGISDTLAKWYEPHYKDRAFVSNILSFGARQALEFLREQGGRVADRAEQGLVDEDTVRTIDAIILLAGFVGSYAGTNVFNGYAHPYYFVVRRNHATYARLHGEIVAFGLLVQLLYEHRSAGEIRELLHELASVENVFTLEEQGLRHEDVPEIAARIQREFKENDDKAAAERLEQAIFEAEATAQAYKKQQRKKAA